MLYTPFLMQENTSILVQKAREKVYPAEFRFREEMDLLSRQWRSILGSIFVLIYLVLIVFLNLAFYRYEPLETGGRLKDLGYELIPELSDEYEAVVDLPLTFIYVIMGLVVFGTFRTCFPCRRGTFKPEYDQVPYVVNMVRRFGLTYAFGHSFRALTYLVTTVPGGNERCLSYAAMKKYKPSFAECFYRTADVNYNCGDLMFSGHLLLCVLALCIINRYQTKAFGWSKRASECYIAFGVILTIWEVTMIISARHHYTSDCVVALYFTPTWWFCFEYFNPHDLTPDREHIATIILNKHELNDDILTNTSLMI